MKTAVKVKKGSSPRDHGLYYLVEPYYEYMKDRQGLEMIDHIVILSETVAYVGKRYWPAISNKEGSLTYHAYGYGVMDFKFLGPVSGSSTKELAMASIGYAIRPRFWVRLKKWLANTIKKFAKKNKK